MSASSKHKQLSQRPKTWLAYLNKSAQTDQEVSLNMPLPASWYCMVLSQLAVWNRLNISEVLQCVFSCSFFLTGSISFSSVQNPSGKYGCSSRAVPRSSSFIEHFPLGQLFKSLGATQNYPAVEHGLVVDFPNLNGYPPGSLSQPIGFTNVWQKRIYVHSICLNIINIIDLNIIMHHLAKPQKSCFLWPVTPSICCRSSALRSLSLRLSNAWRSRSRRSLCAASFCRKPEVWLGLKAQSDVAQSMFEPWPLRKLYIWNYWILNMNIMNKASKVNGAKIDNTSASGKWLWKQRTLVFGNLWPINMPINMPIDHLHWKTHHQTHQFQKELGGPSGHPRQLFAAGASLPVVASPAGALSTPQTIRKTLLLHLAKSKVLLWIAKFCGGWTIYKIYHSLLHQSSVWSFYTWPIWKIPTRIEHILQFEIIWDNLIHCPPSSHNCVDNLTHSKSYSQCSLTHLIEPMGCTVKLTLLPPHGQVEVATPPVHSGKAVTWNQHRQHWSTCSKLLSHPFACKSSLASSHFASFRRATPRRKWAWNLVFQRPTQLRSACLGFERGCYRILWNICNGQSLCASDVLWKKSLLRSFKADGEVANIFCQNMLLHPKVDLLIRWAFQMPNDEILILRNKRLR